MKPSKTSRHRLARPLTPGSNVVVGPWSLYRCEGCGQHDPVARVDAGQRGPLFLFCPFCMATEASANQAVKAALARRRGLA